jgi:ABC-type transporter Mla MlaB component
MEDLREALSSHAMPWHISWRRLQTIDTDAMPLLDGLFVSLCDEPVSLQFSGSAMLVKCLRGMTPSGDRDIPAGWWQVRLNALRALGMHDEFELAALDYCVTHEVAPPAWEAARCQVAHADDGEPQAFAATRLAANAEVAVVATLPMGLEEGGAGPLELRGNLLGDLTQVLAELDAAHGHGERMVVGCLGLIRVDFSAAGSILNWVAQREAEGRHVQFHGVQRLVAAFFNVIGINEHARVVARPM